MGFLQITHWRVQRRRKGLERAFKEAEVGNSYGCNIYHMFQMFSNYKRVTLSRSPFASGPGSPNPQKSKTVIDYKFCHARWNE